mgnify:CR=1 FL=1
MPGRDSHQVERHHYKKQMKGKFDPVKYQRKHLYAHEHLDTPFHDKMSHTVEPAMEAPVEKPKEDTYQ